MRLFLKLYRICTSIYQIVHKYMPMFKFWSYIIVTIMFSRTTNI